MLFRSRFWRGDAASAGALATRLAGSSDLFGAARRPSSSVNFIAAHDGFTLRDCVTFAAKNNLVNGEENRDGNDHEIAWPGGEATAGRHRATFASAALWSAIVVAGLAITGLTGPQPAMNPGGTVARDVGRAIADAVRDVSDIR